ncbi:homocysteine S-methyltransferase family protein [Clostridium sp.]|jgi:methionine synthase I (cobalamin-dependent)|uniref:homocysteine S-methyltransferase family protein n=1 Tax=Clostridium sp. TaxID=1506 RepID=UPI002849F072|nr:homocysteine S-methyltransferase family protein [Clostridium sp.]MDR3598633.1 homocysteine S-methyltransferase family protein [Clostridium sp.]
MASFQDAFNIYKFNLKVFGGCCGTDNRHIEEIAQRLIKTQSRKYANGGYYEFSI